jgi:hypothetical protein
MLLFLMLKVSVTLVEVAKAYLVEVVKVHLAVIEVVEKIPIVIRVKMRRVPNAEKIRKIVSAIRIL